MLSSEISSHASSKQILDFLIIGGGLSGLTVAHEIHRRFPSASWKLLEARPILGGRLANDEEKLAIDLGGAWIWPQHQPFMQALTSSLNLTTFQQPDDPSAMRVDGGAVQYIHSLAKLLPPGRILLNSPVTALSLESIHAIQQKRSNSSENSTASTIIPDKVVCIQTKTDTLVAKRVVVAVPPKVASLLLNFQPPLSVLKQRAMHDCPTWMAGVTKISLLYASNFWTSDSSNLAFPTRGRSNGPAFQVYDASTKDGSVAALTFFTFVPSSSPASSDDGLLAVQVATQMEEMWKYFRLPFASQAMNYTGFCVMRWPLVKYISEDASPKFVHPHPQPAQALSTNEWNDHLLFAGSESDLRSPGVMEGAVSAAMRVMNSLQKISVGSEISKIAAK